MVQTSRTLQIELPPPFPANFLDYVTDAALSLPQTSATVELTHALAAVGYRYRAMHDAQRMLQGSLAVTVRGRTPEEKFVQDSHLMHFLTDGLSSIEALAFSAYLCGHLTNAPRFPIHAGALAKVTPMSVEKLFRRTLPQAGLTASLRRLCRAREFEEWKSMRTTLTHRSQPALQPHHLLVSKVAELDETWLRRKRGWLDDQILVLLRELLSFMGKEVQVQHAQPVHVLVN
ncbi:MAG: hypothetical protein V4510_05345 [bacterium]